VEAMMLVSVSKPVIVTRSGLVYRAGVYLGTLAFSYKSRIWSFTFAHMEEPTLFNVKREVLLRTLGNRD
jgi:hypothetical protein